MKSVSKKLFLIAFLFFIIGSIVLFFHRARAGFDPANSTKNVASKIISTSSFHSKEKTKTNTSSSPPSPSTTQSSSTSSASDPTETSQQQTSTQVATSVSAPAENFSTLARTSASTLQADTICVNGKMISYVNAGMGSAQSIIDSSPYGVAATWGGAPIFSGCDGQNTHFIGHNPGAFACLFSLAVGNQLQITDSNGTIYTYQVTEIISVNDEGYEVNTGADYWEKITGVGSGERVTLQACIDDTTNLIVFASQI